MSFPFCCGILEIQAPPGLIKSKGIQSMIKSAYSLMKSLLHLVSSDQDLIWIDYENCKFIRVHDGSEPELSVAFPPGEPSIRGLLKLLHDGGFIILQNHNEYCTLTYKSFYYDEFRREEVASFWKRSIWIPLAVAVLGNIAVEIFKATAPLVSLLLQQWLQ